MSFHILHVLRHGVILARERGFLLMKEEGRIERKMPLEDIRSVVIAARGVTLTSSFLSGVLSAGAVIIHCDEKYRPCGISAPCSRIVDPRSMLAQGDRSLKIHARLWRRLVKAKITNQSAVLEKMMVDSGGLKRLAAVSNPDEGRAARWYWKRYFSRLGEAGTRRRVDDTPLNRRLNYGYAVVSALCHRSIVAHGLSPLFGIHHIPRYQAHAFVYDLVEPLRPFVDSVLATFMKAGGGEMKDWCRSVAEELTARHIRAGAYRLKLLDAIDRYVASVASCYAEKKIRTLWIPACDEEFDSDGLASGHV